MTRLALERLDLWSDVALNGGVRVAPIRRWLAYSESQKIDGEHNINFQVQADHPAIWTDVVPGTKENLHIDQVVRRTLSDGTYSEHRIGTSVVENQHGRLTRSVTARSILQDLGFRSVITRGSGDGKTTASFEALGLTMAQHIQSFLFPGLIAAGQTFWVIGTMAHTHPVDMVYDRDTPLSALRKLGVVGALASGNLELVVVRTDAGYEISLLAQIGIGLTPVRVTVNRTLLDLGFTESETDQATSMATFGSPDGEVRPTLGQATWDVVSVTGGAHAWVVKLKDPSGGPGPIAFDDQFVRVPIPVDGGLAYHVHFVSADYIGRIIACSAANQTVTLDVVAAPPDPTLAAHRVRIAADTWGTENIFVENPAMVAIYGRRAAYLDCPDIPTTDNLVPNAVCRVWPTASPLPTGWFLYSATSPVQGSIDTDTIVTRETNPVYWEHGGAAVRVKFPTANLFNVLFSPAATLPLRAQGYLSFFMRVTTIFGKIRVGLLLQRRATDYVGAAAPSLPFVSGSSYYYLTPDQSGQLVADTVLPILNNIDLNVAEDIGIAACWNLSDLPLYGGSAWVIVSPNYDAINNTECIVEAAQITVSDHQLPLCEGNGGVKLHQAANNRVGLYGPPSPVVTISPLDLAYMDATQGAAYAQMTPGAPIEINDPLSNVSIITRIAAIQRSAPNFALPTIEVSNLRPDLTRLMAAAQRSSRHLVTTNPQGTRMLTFAP